jgi:hypothetical protein
MLTEERARQIVGKDICNWLDSKGFTWSNSLPYTSLQGWTLGWMSLICNEDGIDFKTVEELNNHYNSVQQMQSK